MADTAIIIPARRASTRLPEKLLRADTGRALITYAVDAAERARAQSAGAISEVIVATDHERIFDTVNTYAASHGLAARALMTSPNHKSGSDRIAEVAAQLPSEIGIIINIQGDEPDLPARDILRVGELLRQSPVAAMSTLVRPIFDKQTFCDPNAVKVVRDHAGFCLYFSRAPIPHNRDSSISAGGAYGLLHLGIYGYRREVLLSYKDLPASELEDLEKLEQLRALSAGLRIIGGDAEYTGVGIDTAEDYARFVKDISA